MKTFKTLSEVGRGRLLFQTESDENSEELYRATTNEYLRCRGAEEIILPSQSAAIEWAVDHDLCHDKAEFLKRCTEVVRIPWKSVIPEVRPYCGGSAELESPVDPNLRIEELIQHPAYNTCIVQHEGGEEVIRLNNKQREKVVCFVQCIFESDYCTGKCVLLPSGDQIGYSNNEQFVQMFYVMTREHCYELETYSVFSGKNLPHYFKPRKFDEVTWLKVHLDNLNKTDIPTKLALLGIAWNMHYQINYEYNYSPDMYPLEILQDLGILPYEESPEPYDY